METKNLSDLYLPVEKVSMEDLLPRFKHLSGLSYATIITLPNGDQKIANYCSEDYHLTRNEEVIPPLIREISQFYDVDVKARTRFFTRFYIDIILKQKELTMSKDDKVNPRIRVVNSYDGSVKYHFQMGFWRKICSNGLMGFVNWDSIKRMHTPGLEDLTDFTKVMEMTSLFLAECEEHFDRYRELSGQTVRNPLLRIEEIVDETDFPTSLMEDVVERLEEERKILKVDITNDWLIYNAFNYQLNHAEDYKAKEEKKAKIDSQVFQYLLNY